MKFVLRVRFTNSLSATEQIHDLDIPLDINDSDDVNRLVTTKWIKQQIRNTPQCANKRLILIYNGRVLNETTDFKDILKVGEEPVVVYINCMIGEVLTQQQLREESTLDRPQEVSTTPQVQGFDRLLQQGFSQEDIDDLRQQFQAIHSMPTNSRQDIHDLEEEESRRRLTQQMEERWIESTVNDTAPTATADVSGATRPAPEVDDATGNTDLLIGLLVGTFLGLLSLVFISVDDTVFDKKQKMAVFVGVTINVFYAILRGRWL